MRLVSSATVLVLALSLLSSPQASAQNHPFGSHPMAYAGGAILPDHVMQSALDQAVRDFYDEWKQRYLFSTCGAGRYVVATAVGPGNLTVSEGHGYGMMLAALMAGYDPDARAIFDGMFAYFRAHPTSLHPYLMSWNQKKSCVDAVDGDLSATDGDLDIAFALLLADKQWGSCGAIDYLAEAENVMADIRDGEVDVTASYTLLGDWVDPVETLYYESTRSSDFMPDHFASFAAASLDPDWTNLRDTMYGVIDDLQNAHSPATGLLPDFIADPAGTPAPAAPSFLEAPTDGAYAYNACRDPWRIGTDFLVSGDARAQTAVQRINDWIIATTGGDPSAIGSGYALDGTPTPGTDYLSMAFVAPLGVGAMVDAGNQAWLNDVWDLVTATSVDAEGYYENTLKLLSMIAMSGNWWAPQAVAGGCAPSGTPTCTDGGYLTDVQLTLTGVSNGPSAQGLKVKGSVFFPLGTVPAFDDGAQILVEDLGAGSAALYDLTTSTSPVPASSVSGCDPSDAWKVTTKTTTYRNASGALDPPACTAGSANGLRQLRYKTGAGDAAFQIKAKGATIAAPVGPIRLTLVLGDDAAASSGGECGLSNALDCTTSGTKVVCR